MNAKTPTRVGIMVDSETLAKRPNAVAWQIAFIAFDLDDPEAEPIRRADEYLPIQPQLSLGRVIDADTLLWWMKQPEAARAKMQRCNGNDMDELTALVGSIHKKMVEVIGEADYYEVIARGIDFDFPILESLFDMCGLGDTPYAYNKKIDLRTVMNEAGVKTADVPKRAGLVDHNADHDCLYQIDCLFEARRRMRAAI